MQRAGRASSELLPCRSFLAVLLLSGVSAFVSFGPPSLLVLLLLVIGSLFSAAVAVGVVTFELMVGYAKCVIQKNTDLVFFFR